LIAYETGSQKPGHIYLKDTDYYRTQNATMSMPKWVNDADREIDEKRSESMLRTKAEAILNDVSQGHLTPHDALVKFLKEAQDEVGSAVTRLKDRVNQEQVAKVLKIYQEVITGIQKAIGEKPHFFWRLIGLKKCEEEACQPLIFCIRYAAIRDYQIKQAALMQSIDVVKKEIFAGIRKRPNHMNTAFRATLVELANPAEKQRFIKLLNYSEDHFNSVQNKSQKTHFQNAKNLIQNSPIFAKMRTLVESITTKMAEFREQERGVRGPITRQLRVQMGWSQEKLAEMVNALYANTVSRQNISSLERGKMFFSDDLAKKIAHGLGIDTTLLIPEFYFI
jgi:ribosome-binding protein aMBF1 (putative translation factor)